MRKLKQVLIAVIICSLLCATFAGTASAAYGKPYYIEVDLTNQIVTIYNTQDNSIARQMLCSAGMNDCTPTGTWYMPTKEKDDERRKWYYFKSFRCYAQYATRIFGLYFFHSITFNRRSEDSMSKTAAAAFGNPASHGCIRLRIEDAQFIAENCMVGTRVKIFKSNEKDEELRKLLYVSSYHQEDMTYREFMGYSDDSLGRGSSGEEVEQLQNRLHELGYYEQSTDGSYNAETTAAVKELQKDLGLAQTGVVNTDLAEVIYSEDAPVSDGLIVSREGQTGPTVKKLQMALSKLKLYKGDIDGVYDLDVAVAVDEFQRMCGFEVDGRYATPEVQKAIYYEIGEITKAVGADFTVNKETESVNMATVVTPDKVRINVRSKPDTESSSIGQLKYGEKVLVTAAKDNWAQIVCKAGTGFLMKKYLEPYPANNEMWIFTGANGETYRLGRTVEEMVSGAPSESKRISSYIASEQFSRVASDVEYCTVNTGSDGVTLNLRKAGDPSAEILASIPNGTRIRVINHGDNWTKVGYNTCIGYLMNDYLSYGMGTTDEIVSTAVNMDTMTGGITFDNGTSLDESDDQSGDVSEDGGITAIVVPDKKGRHVTIYTEADDDAEEVGKLSPDSEVNVLAVNEETGWCLITQKDKKGYVKDVNLSFRLGTGI